MGLLDVCATLWMGGRLFLTFAEAVRFAAVALGTAIGFVMLVWMAARRSTAIVAAAIPSGQRARAPWIALAVWVVPLATAMAWMLTSGRRVASMPLRPLVVLAVGAAAAAVVGLALRRCLRAPSSFLALAAALLACAAIVVDVLVLPRLYPAFHWGLLATAIGGASFAFLSIRTHLRRRWSWSRAWMAIVLAPAFLLVADGSNVGFVAERHSPLAGKLITAWTALVGRFGPMPGAGSPAVKAPVSAPAVARAPGIRLGDADVLLITIDALRADRLGVYGGHVPTPSIDALAAEGFVFRRAYTPTPHTSYALSSLLTGKYLKPVFQLPGARPDHPTLPEILRRYGYRTAAFYPPAVFFVDGDRFEAMRGAGWGFEYRKEMYLDARKRAAQLDHYLRTEAGDHTVFAWVHLFEPHEPYDPQPPYDQGATLSERYDGEVRVCDDAVGALVKTFREHRPRGTVILTADHGEEFGDHGGWYHGTTLYDEQVRVPLIWSSPGVVTPGTSDAPVDLPDVAATLLTALGIPRDARMRGDDLGPLLAGSAAAGPTHAFATTADEQMVVSKRYKAICRTGQARCRVYDLERDPRETHNLGPARADLDGELRAALGAFMSSIPRVEAMAVGQTAWPEPLARSELGDPTVLPELVPLLGDSRPAVRVAAARALGGVDFPAAKPILGRLARMDPDAEVRAEAAIAALTQGDSGVVATVQQVLKATTPPAGKDRVQRAALALGAHGDESAIGVLIELVSDDKASEDVRRKAAEFLGAMHAAEAVDALGALLADVRLRTDAARALGSLGDRRAADFLLEALRGERYLPARYAEADALTRLGDRRAASWVRRYLGMGMPLPDGVDLLVRLGELQRPSGRGALLANARVRRGSWTCEAAGCTPGADAALVLPQVGAPRGPAQLVVRALASEPASLRVGDVERTFAPMAHEAVYPLPSTSVLSWSVRSTAPIQIVAVAVVPLQDEIPPPAPEIPPDQVEP